MFISGNMNQDVRLEKIQDRLYIPSIVPRTGQALGILTKKKGGILQQDKRESPGHILCQNRTIGLRDSQTCQILRRNKLQSRKLTPRLQLLYSVDRISPILMYNASDLRWACKLLHRLLPSWCTSRSSIEVDSYSSARVSQERQWTANGHNLLVSEWLLMYSF